MRLLGLLSAAGMAVALAFSGSAIAAPGTANWSGFYIGAVGAGGIHSVNTEDYWCDNACDAPSLEDWDASIGGLVGVNWHNGNLVLGLAGDFSTGFDRSENVLFNDDPDGVVWSGEWNWYATARAVAGLATGNALVYVTAGAAFVDVDYAALQYDDGVFVCDTTQSCASYSDTETGFAAGAGIGFPLADHVNMTFEYLYIGLPSEKDRYSDYTDPDSTDGYVTWTSSAHLARLGIVWSMN